MTMRGLKVDWLHAAEASVLFGLAVFAVASLTGSVPLLPLLLIAAVLTTVVFLSVAVTTESAPLALLTGLTGAASAAWLVYVRHSSPWTLAAITSWALGVIVLTAWGAISYAKHLAHMDRERVEHEREQNLAELRRWTDLLETMNIKGVTAKRVVKTRAGHTVTYRLPKDGTVKFQALLDVAERIEIAGLPGGIKLKTGAVRFERGAHAGEVVMMIQEREVLADEIPFPNDLSPLTISEPFDVGWSEDGSLALIWFRELRLLVIGETGSGKTNLLHVIIAQLSRCVDTIIFGIDLSGGTLLAPWVKPWVDKQTRRPVIDWPATDRAEAERLLASLLNLCHSRARLLAGRDDKINPSVEQPAFVLVCDELTELFSTAEPKDYRDKYHANEPTPRILSYLASKINNTGRKSAVDAVWATQRSTTTHIPSDIKSQCAMRVGLGTSTIAEASNLVPDSPAAQKIMALLKYAGTGVVWRKDKQVRADKFYWLPVERIAKIAAHVGEFIRPEPGEFDRAALGPDYESRWARLAPLLAEWSDMGAPEGERTFEQIVAQMPDPEAGLRQWQRRARAIVSESGRLGIRPGIVADRLKNEGMGVDRATLQRWLRTQAQEGFMETRKHGMWRIARNDDDATGTDGR